MNKEELQAIRVDYTKHSLSEHEVQKDPIEQFNIWFKEALNAEVSEVNAMNLATVDESGQPKSRIVLIKGVEDSGFVFFTNYESDKGKEIKFNPKVSLCFFWHELERQVRIDGIASKIDEKESSDYFQSRPLMSKIGAWTSNQSEVVDSREYLEEKFKELKDKYSDGDVPKPDYWGGYVVKPTAIEFWQGRASRLHDRIKYEKTDFGWDITRLSP